ncbi:MAG: hypothetical protein ISN29_01610 [Gammaproteobacteria bacterium AqS3]|nr:hypothetical protein [Gammaproteobacteria bacterium AqS3]
MKERLPDGQPKVTLDDVCDVNEYLSVKNEIERRAYKASERKQQLKMPQKQ